MTYNNTYRPDIDISIACGLNKNESGGYNYGVLIDGNVVFVTNEKSKADYTYSRIWNAVTRMKYEIDDIVGTYA